MPQNANFYIFLENILCVVHKIAKIYFMILILFIAFNVWYIIYAFNISMASPETYVVECMSGFVQTRE